MLLLALVVLTRTGVFAGAEPDTARLKWGRGCLTGWGMRAGVASAGLRALGPRRRQAVSSSGVARWVEVGRGARG